MRIAYRALGITIVALVAVQAAAHAWSSAGLGIFVSNGGVVDPALMASEEPPFPEVVGFMVHGLNGMYVIPVVALAMLVVSFFTRIRGTVLWAAVTLGLVALQVTLGILGHSASIYGLLHGLNALALASAAFYAQSLASRERVARQAGPTTTEQSTINA